jgi:hypothetical protein
MKDLDTTLVLQGAHAATFSEIAQFAEKVEERPLDKLLGDLRGLATLSAAKFELAALVVRRRVRELTEVEREQVRVFAEEVAAEADPEAAARIREAFVRRS